jgi:DNA-binding MarR family transcriptional regulator
MIRVLIMPGRVMELISRAHLQWKRRIARDLLPHGINPKQIHLLRKLAESGSLAPSEIAELVFADRPTTTSLLGTLERVGWITRRRDPSNRRRVIVEITAAGRKKLASVPQHLWRTGKMAIDPEAGLSTAERSELRRLLEKLNARIDREVGR